MVKLIAQKHFCAHQLDHYRSQMVLPVMQSNQLMIERTLLNTCFQIIHSSNKQKQTQTGAYKVWIYSKRCLCSLERLG